VIADTAEPHPPGTARRAVAIPLAVLTVAAGVLRFSTLDLQSYWLDETFTAIFTGRDLDGLLSGVADAESTPPLYYLLTWVWAQVFGTGEVGLRSLSALLGTATVPVAYVAGAALLSRRAGLIAAAMVAVSPLMVWYSQEARAYALLALLGAVCLWLFARALDDPQPRRLLALGVVAALAVLTHYYALFLVAPMAIWLLVRAGRTRWVIAAVAIPVVVAAALAPLALAQHEHGGASAVSAEPLGARIEAAARKFLTGEYGGPVGGLTHLAALLALAAVLLLLARGTPAIRRRAAIAASLGAFAVVAPVIGALAGADYFTSRYLLAAWLPLALVCAAGMATPGRLGPLVAVLLCGLLLAISVAVPLDPDLQRDDWRSMAEALERPPEVRAIVVAPSPGFVPLDFYLAGASRLPAGEALLREVAVLSVTRDPDGIRVRAPAPGFREVERLRRPSYTLVRFRSARPVELDEKDFGGVVANVDRPGLLLQRPGAPQ
jgi:mannosyltransferase